MCISRLWSAFFRSMLPFLHSNGLFFLHPAAFTAETSCPHACPPTSPFFCALSVANVTRFATTQAQNVTNGRESRPSTPSSCTSSHPRVPAAVTLLVLDVQQVSECKNPSLPPPPPPQTPPPVPSAPFHLWKKTKQNNISQTSSFLLCRSNQPRSPLTFDTRLR